MRFLKTGTYVNLADKSATEAFVNVFKTLHSSGKLKELYLKGTGITNIDSKLRNISPAWTALQCDS